MSSEQVASIISVGDFSDRPITLIGFGYMGHHFLDAFKALGVGRVRICTRSVPSELPKHSGEIEVISGGVDQLDRPPEIGELGIVATPTTVALEAAERLLQLGYRDILIEKPVLYRSGAIASLASKMEASKVNARAAYNRVAYPSYLEAKALADKEGGVRSCTYAFTEMVRPDWPEIFPDVELSRWGIANSLHVIGMAHGLIGMPQKWTGYRSGKLSWHPTGSVFVGSGLSTKGIPFSYHADWGSKSRWAVEVQSEEASYRLCPLEKVYRKKASLGDWEELSISVFAPEVKEGVTEEVAAMLNSRVASHISLPTLREAATLAKHAEDLFGYS